MNSTKSNFLLNVLRGAKMHCAPPVDFEPVWLTGEQIDILINALDTVEKLTEFMEGYNNESK